MIIKSAAEGVLAAARPYALAPGSRPRQAVVLAYHNVVPDGLAGGGDASLHLPLSLFRRQLDLICRDYQPLSLQELLTGNWEKQSGRMPVTITFDDSYRGALALALPELIERGITATIFVAPALLGDRTPWWDAMAEAWTGLPEPNLRSRILGEGQGKPEAAKRMGERHGIPWQDMPECFRISTEAELVGAVLRGACTVGSHSWSHASLVTLTDAAVEEELSRSRTWLMEKFRDAYVDALAYPYGHWSSSVETVAERCGYRAALALGKGSLRAGRTGVEFRLPRMNVPAGLSVNGMKVRMPWR